MSQTDSDSLPHRSATFSSLHLPSPEHPPIQDSHLNATAAPPADATPPKSESQIPLQSASANTTQQALEQTSSNRLPDLNSQDDFEFLFDPAIDFETHLKKKSPLDRLNPEHQAGILKLLELHPAEHVAELLSRPLPFGLAISTSKPALNRFAARHRAAIAKREREQKILTAQEVIFASDDPTAVFNQLSSHLFQMRILATASESDPNLKNLHTLVNCLTKLRRAALAEPKQGGNGRAATVAPTPSTSSSPQPPTAPVASDPQPI